MLDETSARRLWAKVVKHPDGCWEWTGTKTWGYGVIKVLGKTWRVHRLVYETMVGPIPDGKPLDHLCRNRACCNPQHLEPVTHRENTRRSPIAPATINRLKTHCKHGHEFTPENTIRQSDGYRGCLECRRIWHRNRARVRNGVTPDRYRKP